MADLSAKNFGIAGIFIILLLLAGLMLLGFMTYLAWHQENPWPTSTQPHSGRLFAPPVPKPPSVAPAILFGDPPIPQPNRQGQEL
jgi:flagellar basal body-associated protein FliL